MGLSNESCYFKKKQLLNTYQIQLGRNKDYRHLIKYTVQQFRFLKPMIMQDRCTEQYVPIFGYITLPPVTAEVSVVFPGAIIDLFLSFVWGGFIDGTCMVCLLWQRKNLNCKWKRNEYIFPERIILYLWYLFNRLFTFFL